MAKVFTHGDDQKRFDETRTKMEEIKKALLGTSGAYANGQRQFAGYITDMGELPGLDENDQPDSLWEQADQRNWEYDQGARIWMGWRGPYIEAPPEDLFKDAWGNSFVFDDVTNPGNLIITSKGANGVISGTDTGFDKDITLTIRKTQYRAPVAGKVGKLCTEVKMCFPDSERGDSDVILWEIIKNDSYFRFEDNVNGDSGVPVGIRSVVVLKNTGKSDTHVFTIEPTGNWLGTLETEN